MVFWVSEGTGQVSGLRFVHSGCVVSDTSERTPTAEAHSPSTLPLETSTSSTNGQRCDHLPPMHAHSPVSADPVERPVSFSPRALLPHTCDARARTPKSRSVHTLVVALRQRLRSAIRPRNCAHSQRVSTPPCFQRAFALAMAIQRTSVHCTP